MTIAYACDSMFMFVEFSDEILSRGEGENVKPEKNSIFLKKW